MALTWDATAVRDFDQLTDDERVTREALIFATMAVGMGEITEDNAQEFYTRLSFWEKVNGAYRFGDGEALYFTPEDVKRFIGLRTNVFPKMTKAKFHKHVFETHERFNVSSKDFN